MRALRNHFAKYDALTRAATACGVIVRYRGRDEFELFYEESETFSGYSGLISYDLIHSTDDAVRMVTDFAESLESEAEFFRETFE